MKVVLPFFLDTALHKVLGNGRYLYYAPGHRTIHNIISTRALFKLILANESTSAYRLNLRPESLLLGGEVPVEYTNTTVAH